MTITIKGSEKNIKKFKKFNANFMKKYKLELIEQEEVTKKKVVRKSKTIKEDADTIIND